MLYNDMNEGVFMRKLLGIICILFIAAIPVSVGYFGHQYYDKIQTLERNALIAKKRIQHLQRVTLLHRQAIIKIIGYIDEYERVRKLERK